VVQGFPPALGGGDGDLQVVLYFILPDELIEAAGPEAGVKGYILGAGFT
jgi:hypothetical protein